MKRRQPVRWFPLLGILGACAGPRAAILNLRDVHRDTGETSLAYAVEVPDRGAWETFLGGTQAIFGSQRTPDLEEVSDPVEFCLDNLAVLKDADPDDLDVLDVSTALVEVADMGRRDFARVVRSDSFRTLQALRGLLPHEYAYRRDRTTDEEAAELLEPLQALAVAAPGEVEALLERRAGELRAAAGQVEQLRSDRAELADRIARLAVLAARQAEGHELAADLESCAAVQSLHAAFLAGVEGLGDSSLHVQSEAVRMLFQWDAAGASLFLARRYDELRSPLVKVRMFQAIIDFTESAAELEPVLRRRMGGELDSRDVAVLYWAKRCLAILLDESPRALSLEEVRHRWQALGDWDAVSEPS